MNFFLKHVARRICLFNFLFCKDFCCCLDLKTACEFLFSLSLYTHPKIPCDDSTVNNICKLETAWFVALNIEYLAEEKGQSFY